MFEILILLSAFGLSFAVYYFAKSEEYKKRYIETVKYNKKIMDEIKHMKK